VAAKHAGKTGKCPQCKSPIVVPKIQSQAHEKPPAGDLSGAEADRSSVAAEGQAASPSEIEKPSHRRKIIWTITAIGLLECVLAIGGLITGAIVHDDPPVYVILPLVFSLLVFLVVLIAVTAAISLINALMIQIFTHWVCGFKPKYGTVYIACLLGNMASNLIMAPLQLLFALIDDPSLVIPLWLIASAFCFVIYVYILGLLLVHPERGPIGFGKACLVVLLGMLVALVIGGILVAISLLMGFPW
jgi:hypothetical protein